MKFLLFNRKLLIAVLTAIFPLALFAGENGFDKPVRNKMAESLRPLFQDSVPAKKKPAAKPQKPAEKQPQDINERLKETVGSAIKQVPRSVPKLKPQPVTDRIKIKRQ
ncbi:MAG: hypothetical protein WKF68_09455 [Daejeonella sp.]